MRKFSINAVIMVILFTGFLLSADLVTAQGTSPVRVNKISVSPSSFKAGDRLTITIEIENTSRSRYGCVGGAYFKAFLSIYKAEPFTVSNRLWETDQTLRANLRPGEKRTVTFASRWTVPSMNYEKYIFNATGPICAPDEFGRSAKKEYVSSCTYSSPMPLLRLPKVATKDLIKKKIKIKK